jgi:hypothetical protein
MTIADERLQDLDRYPTLRAFEREGIFILSHLFGTQNINSLISSEGHPNWSPFTTSNPIDKVRTVINFIIKVTELGKHRPTLTREDPK